MAKPKKLPSGNWRVRVYDYTDRENKKHYKSFTASSKKEVMMLANEYIVTRGTETYEDMSLAEACRRYIDSRDVTLSPATIKGYESYLKNDFKKLMKYKLSKITQEDIQIAVNELAGKNARKTIKNKYDFISATLGVYRPQLKLRIKLPNPKVKEQKDIKVIPTSDQVNILLEHADEKIRVPILLASSGSLRRAEICALMPDDITDTGIYINKDKVIDKDNNVIIKTPKTKAGIRFVPLHPDIIKEVREWKYFDCSLDQIEKWFHKVCKATGINTTLHKLRHYFASECHAKGIPDKYIAEVGGWDDVTVLQKIYQHTLSNKSKEMNDKIVSLFNDNITKDDTKMTQVK